MLLVLAIIHLKTVISSLNDFIIIPHERVPSIHSKTQKTEFLIEMNVCLKNFSLNNDHVHIFVRLNE